MPDYLILKLKGVMQSWGGHTFEDYRPSEIFPTRSALVGLLGACCGVRRDDKDGLKRLDAALEFTVRADREDCWRMVKIEDFHTVEGARTVKGKPRDDLTPTRREYLCDACFTVAIAIRNGAGLTRDELVNAVHRPIFPPFLGRRSCPLSRPLYEAEITAKDAIEALSQICPHKGIIYGEHFLPNANHRRVRDVALYHRTRQFMTRDVWFHDVEAASGKEAS